MWNPFRRKPVAVETAATRAEKAYRKRRIEEIANHTFKTYDEAERLADKWVISAVLVSVDGATPRPQYIAHQIWDDEWLLIGKHHDTREDALAYVRERGGELIVPTGT